MLDTVRAGLSTDVDGDHRTNGDVLREKQNWTLRFDEFKIWDQKLGPFTVDACCDPSGRNALVKTFWDDCLAEDWAGHVVWCNPPYT